MHESSLKLSFVFDSDSVSNCFENKINDVKFKLWGLTEDIYYDINNKFL